MADTQIETEETAELIASNKVEGTVVHDAEGERLGTIYNLMIDKRTGEVEYAVLSFGGLFGLGSDYYPLPWETLTYSEDHGGYVVNVDKETLKEAPRYSAGREPTYNAAYGDEVYGYYDLDYPRA